MPTAADGADPAPVPQRARRIREHFDRVAPALPRWRRRNRFYHDDQARTLQKLVTAGQRVMVAGCGVADLLERLAPADGLGVELSAAVLAQERARHPGLRLVGLEALDEFPAEAPFDWIVLVDLVGYLDDVQQSLEGLHRMCGPRTRVVVTHHNFLWEPVLRLAERLGLKMPTPEQSWLSPADLGNLLELADFEVVKIDRRLLLPYGVPLLAPLFNALAHLPGLGALCLSHYVVARRRTPREERRLSTTVVVPCRNERGNIEAAVRRMPEFAAGVEIIFVDGHSTDGTPEEIERVIAAYPGRRIRLLRQSGTGKGDAVRLGFEAATGDVLMILDADLTVPPEDLPKFHRALATDKAEFLNGSRLVYPMEREAMRTLNRIANKTFAMLFSWLLGQRIKDTLCGTKVISREHYRRLAANRAYFGDFDPFGDFDLLFGASKMSLKIVEIPIRYHERRYGETKIQRFRHGWLLLRMVLFAARRLKFS